MDQPNLFPRRDQVALAATWNLADIFPGEADFEQALAEITQTAADFTDNYQGKMTDAAKIVAAAQVRADIQRLQSKLDHYVFLPVETNHQDSALVLRQHKVANILQQVNAALLFFENELKITAASLLDEAAAAEPQLAGFINQIKRAQKISLGAEVEIALNEFKPVFEQPYHIYLQAKLADMVFPDFEVNGQIYPLSFVLYEELYMYSDDTKVRREAFKIFSGVLAQFQETVAAVYYSHVRQEKAQASLRGFDSVIDYLLFDQQVPRELYDSQIDTIMTDLAPVMQKYATHLQAVRGLDTLTYADLKIDLDPEFSRSVSFAESRNYIAGATAVLGEEYVQAITRAYSERWVDYAQNSGKSTGGFCTMPAEVHPYVLMSWTEQLADVYTLIHELGHAGQMLAAESNNFYLTAEPSLYLIEAPSTFNELLLSHYLAGQAADDRTQRFARTKMLTNTYFHNFVTHLLEAAYQREVYQLVDANEGFTAATLSAIKRKVLTDFWGEAVDINEGAELTWLRQPHYFMGLYPYTYSAGLTIATQAYLNVAADKPGAVTAWLDFLKLGNMDVVAAAKVAGVDVTTDAPLRAAIAFLDQTVAEIIAYTAALDH